MKNRQPKFNYKLCMTCGICVQACPVSCLALKSTEIDSYHKAYPVMIDKNACISCGICEAECPLNAIVLVETGAGSVA